MSKRIANTGTSPIISGEEEKEADSA